MTDTAMTLGRQLRPARRLWRWLTSRSRRPAPAAHLDTLSDRMLRDIGVERDEIRRMAISTLNHAMRCAP